MESFFEIAKKELALEKLDIEKILENTTNYSYLEGKSVKQMSQDNYDSLLAYPEELREHYYKQLEEYRLVEKVCDLRLGMYTKILSENYCKVKKGKGGILVKVDVFEDKISLLCKNGAYFQRYSFNDFIVFQKISLEEKLVLLSYEY
jgi:hypothetical protein